jgi:hypothetical protein
VERSRPTICCFLGQRPLSAEETIAALGCEFDLTYRTVAANPLSNPDARLKQVDVRIIYSATTRQLDEPDSLLKLSIELNAKNCRVRLPMLFHESLP